MGTPEALMGNDFDSFDEGPMGTFMESALGARDPYRDSQWYLGEIGNFTARVLCSRNGLNWELAPIAASSGGRRHPVAVSATQRVLMRTVEYCSQGAHFFTNYAAGAPYDAPAQNSGILACMSLAAIRRVVVSVDDGATWVNVTLPHTSGHTSAIQSTSSRVIVINGAFHMIGTRSGGLVKQGVLWSSLDGFSWSETAVLIPETVTTAPTGTGPVLVALEHVAYFYQKAGVYYVGALYSGNTAALFSSTNLVSWALVSTPAFNAAWGINQLPPPVVVGSRTMFIKGVGGSGVFGCYLGQPSISFFYGTDDGTRFNGNSLLFTSFEGYNVAAAVVGNSVYRIRKIIGDPTLVLQRSDNGGDLYTTLTNIDVSGMDFTDSGLKNLAVAGERFV